MDVIATAIPDVKLIRPCKHGDARGFFMETYSEHLLAQHGIHDRFVQDNHSLSRDRGTLRGLHFQLPPFAQAKLVRVVRGRVFDVAVDIRRGSPTFGRHVAVELSADGAEQLYVPAGFAHGFCTLEPDTEFVYKVSARYSRDHDRGLAWNDPALSIRWPVSEADVILSDKDRANPTLADAPDLFVYEGETV